MIEPLVAPYIEDENIVVCLKCKSGARYFIGKECSVCKKIELQIAVQLLRKGMNKCVTK